MRKNFFMAILFIAIIISLGACVKEQVTPEKKATVTQKQIAQTVLGNSRIKMAVYSRYDSLFVGYNPLYITLLDTVANTSVTSAAIALQPVMDMVSMKHSCPVEQPAYAAADNNFKGAAVFTMATDGAMGWALQYSVFVNGNTYTGAIPIVVKAKPPAIKLVTTVMDQNNTAYYLALVHPQQPEQVTGLIDLEVAVYKRVDMMAYTPADGLVLDFKPLMPSMGHSSPNNIAPAGIGNGHYKGKVNFTMTGDWQLDFAISGTGSTFNSHAYLNILF